MGKSADAARPAHLPHTSVKDQLLELFTSNNEAAGAMAVRFALADLGVSYAIEIAAGAYLADHDVKQAADAAALASAASGA